MDVAVYNFFKDLVPVRTDIKSRVDGDFLTTCAASLNIFYLNGVAKDFFLSCDGVRSIHQLCFALLSEYDIDENILHNDIVNLIREFQWKSLILLKEAS